MLTNDDIAILIKALDAYQNQATGKAITSTLLGVMLTRKEDRQAVIDEADSVMEKAKAESAALEETVILLKAKLIQMRDNATAKELKDFLKKGSE